MSTPAKSPMGKGQTRKKKGGSNPLMLPGLDKLPTKKGGKPVVVVVVKGGKNPPNLSNLPFLMGGKKKKKKKSGKKSKTSVKSGDKKKAARKTGEDEDSLSESDRVSAPDLPKVHTQKAATPTSTTRSDKSVTGVTSSNSSINVSIPRTQPNVLKKATPSKTSTDPVLIQGGIVDRPCVPMFMVIDGPAGCPIIVPLDARDGSGLVPEGGPQPLRVSPSEDTKGYMVVEDGLLHFKPLKDCPEPPANSTPGTLTKFLSKSNIFIADAGPLLPESKEINTAASATIKEKIGVKLAVSGHITIQADKGTCKFTRVAAVTKAPFYPENAAMGVLVKDRPTSLLFWVPTENRFVGPLLSQNVKIPFKPAKEMTIMGNVYKDSFGIITFEAPSNKLDNLIGFIMSSGTGVPMYAGKPEGVGIAATTRPKSAALPVTPVVPSAVVAAAPAPQPSSPAAVAAPPPSAVVAVAAPPPPAATAPPPPAAPEPAAKPEAPVSRDEISPPPTRTPIPPPTLSPTPVPALSPPSPVVEEAPPTPAAPAGPSLGWSLLSTLGSVLSTTASVISNTAGAVTEAATGAGAALPPSNKPATPPSASQPTAPPSPYAAATPSPKAVASTPTLAVQVAAPTATAAKVAAAPKTAAAAKEKPPAPATDAADEEALAADESSAGAAAAARVADAASTGAANGVTIKITVRDSNSNGGKISDSNSNGGKISDSNINGGKISDQKSGGGSGETFSDCNSEGGTGIGDQMASIYRNLLSSQNELPPDPEPEQRDEESKNEEKEEKEEKEERKATPSTSEEESRRKAENSKEYKKYMDNRSVYFSPYGYR